MHKRSKRDMKRRDFVKKIGLGTAAVVVAPTVLLQEVKHPVFDGRKVNLMLLDEVGKWENPHFMLIKSRRVGFTWSYQSFALIQELFNEKVESNDKL